MSAPVPPDDPELEPGAEVRVVRYVAGEMNEAERTRFEAELVADPELAEAVFAQQSLARLERLATASPGADLGRPRRRWAWLGPRALAVALVGGIAIAILVGQDRRPSGPRYRSTPGTIELIEPVGSLERPASRFRWRRHLAAANYRFELVAGSGPPFQALVADTMVDLARLPGAPKGVASGSWRVVPLRSGGAELPAPAPAYFDTPSRREIPSLPQ